jgi:hypothetical protein
MGLGCSTLLCQRSSKVMLCYSCLLRNTDATSSSKVSRSNASFAGLIICMGCCWCYLFLYGLLEQQLEVVLEVTRSLEMAHCRQLVFLLALTSPATDRPCSLLQVAGMWVALVRWDRTSVVALGAYHKHLLEDMGYSRRKGFDRWDRIQLAAFYLEATADH